jgi:NAD(P) transhydrogenase subunit alpha
VEAAYLATSLFPLLMTATGTFSPARVLIWGARVAVFQAIVFTKRLRAMVSTLDFKPTVRVKS